MGYLRSVNFCCGVWGANGWLGRGGIKRSRRSSAAVEEEVKKGEDWG